MLSDSDEEEFLFLYALSRKRVRAVSPKNVKKLKRKRRVWNYNLENQMNGDGEYNRIFMELSKNEDKFYDYFHMSQDAFEDLHEKLVPRISKCSTNFRQPISTRERLVVCLRFLITGVSYATLATAFQLGRSTVSSIIRQTCGEIYNVLKPDNMPEPTVDTWKESEKGFQDTWQFPNCVGCVDGKHLTVKCPIKHIRYDNRNSRIVLMSIIDPWCRFTAIDIGDYGLPNENDLFECTELHASYISNISKVLPSKKLPGTDILVPRVFIGDGCFKLQTCILRAFPDCVARVDATKKRFNDRLSHPYSVVKQCFDLLEKNFKIFKRPLDCDLQTAYGIVKAACCLHNYIINEGNVGKVNEEDNEDLEGSRCNIEGHGSQMAVRIAERKNRRKYKAFVRHKPTNGRWRTQAGMMREKFVDYFNTLN